MKILLAMDGSPHSGEAEEMLANECIHSLIRKVRHEVESDGRTWEVDAHVPRAEVARQLVAVGFRREHHVD